MTNASAKPGPDRSGPGLAQALAAPRIAIERVSPCVDDGRWPAKAVVGQPVTVEADIFMDGHDVLGAEVVWQPQAETRGRKAQRVPMQSLGNDRWRAVFTPRVMGPHVFAIEAWHDPHATHRQDIEKKDAAGVTTELDRMDGKSLEAGTRAHPVRSADLPLEVDRARAAFAAWYELFPRSQTQDEKRHGTFDDVIARLPAIRAMGFDVLYFPPIHPIGTKNRKGRNNSLRARPGDVGSPYAIGATEGGHDAVHPQLGGIEAFRRLQAAAREHELELALDLAIQFSPDHPWLKAHPQWFKWRADGSVKHAENPPKKYEDIVNCDFYCEDRAALWTALRDIVEFWVGEGVKTFRVDNPHTKPLPFWEWLIADVRGRHPDVLFLSEAFTRPAAMYRLAKLGFSQSYTYFTWRNDKVELAEYLTELSTQAPKDFFRPHFFVNTPDINPYFLHGSGRGGFLIRAALASLLSGLWGVYSGFELCEAAPLPGKEEYLDSEKYQIRVRDWTAPGNIVGEISRLNRIRRENAALHTHLNVRFLTAWNDRILYFVKATPDRSSVILAAISLDPHREQETHFELPLRDFGLPDDGVVEAEELMRGTKLRWQGKVQHWRFVPGELPFAVWRVRAAAADRDGNGAARG